MGMRAIARKRDEYADIRVMAKHPMESGLRKDKATGKLIPAHFIETFTATIGGKEVFKAFLGPSISKNPLVRFYIKANKGDKITVKWVDNTGKSDSKVITIK
jgi:sulfur-oxidizing protein SoxZ